jgi:hypothetical protein
VRLSDQLPRLSLFLFLFAYIILLVHTLCPRYTISKKQLFFERIGKMDEDKNIGNSEPVEKLGRLEKLEKQKRHIDEQIKAIQAKNKEKERKNRTRRLIQIGALSEKYFDCVGIEPAEYEEFLKWIVQISAVKERKKRK